MSNISFISIFTNKEVSKGVITKKWQYLFLDTIELYDLDDERGGASFVLNGPKQSPYVVHAEGLWPAPVPPSFDADVQQLEDSTEQNIHTKTETEVSRHQRLAFLPFIYPDQKASKQQDSVWEILVGGEKNNKVPVYCCRTGLLLLLEAQMEGRTQ